MNRTLPIPAALLAVIILSFSMQPASASILNGDFSIPGALEPFESWTTGVFFDHPVDGGGNAVLEVTDFFQAPGLSQLFSLPATATSISFEVGMTTSPGGFGGGFFLDAFQATLFDAAGTMGFFSFLGDPVNFPAFYQLESDGTTSFDPAFVTSTDLGGGVRRVTLDVSSLPPQDLIFDFFALGDDDGLTTTFTVDNVVKNQAANVIPEPASAGIWSLASLAAFLLSRPRRSSGKRSAAPLFKASRRIR